MQRYSKIYKKIPREILLLKSLPCIYSGKCTFCNYVLDNSRDLNEIRMINTEVIQQITGEFGVVEIINSGSVFELPVFVLEGIRSAVNEHRVHTLYFEAFYAYHKRLDEMRNFFLNQEVRYRIGIETFDDDFRKNILKKPFPTSNVLELGRKFYACCLLVCVQGQTREQIQRDIDIARQYFKEITVNVFVNNTTPIRRDEGLFEWFVESIYPSIENDPSIEVLIDNKDQGVYVQ